VGFTDRINDTLRGAKTALESAEMRQRLAEAELARERSLAQLGREVCAAYAGADDADVDTRFAEAWRQAEAASGAVAELTSQVEALAAERAIGPGTKYCGSCGTQMSESAAFCPSCGKPTA
jgi:rubrerythrin